MEVKMIEKAKYITNCINSTGKAITEMVDKAKDITYETFIKHVDWREISEMLGYALHPSQGLTLKNDYHVSYAKSFYKDIPCYYLSWSSIEYIFTR